MPDATNYFQQGICNLLREVFDGLPDGFGYMLNPGDPGLLGELDAIDAATASRSALEGKASIAALADHVIYWLDLLNRWAEGEENPWADADWEASWKRQEVTDPEWDELRARLRETSNLWRKHAGSLREWNEVAATGALASVAHTAYHMGVIRHMVAIVRTD